MSEVDGEVGWEGGGMMGRRRSVYRTGWGGGRRGSIEATAVSPLMIGLDGCASSEKLLQGMQQNTRWVDLRYVGLTRHLHDRFVFRSCSDGPRIGMNYKEPNRG